MTRNNESALEDFLSGYLRQKGWVTKGKLWSNPERYPGVDIRIDQAVAVQIDYEVRSKV